MGTIWIKEFKGGLDTRRLPETTSGGTLIRCYDGHLTQGGEIEQRAIFELVWASPQGSSKGLASTPESLVIFGHASEPAGLPANFIYQQLAHPSGEALVAVPGWDNFGGEIVAAARFADNSRYLFVDGTLVTDGGVPEEPTSVLTANSKINVGSGTSVVFSKIRDATDFTGTGYGFIDMAFEIGDDASVIAIAEYDTEVAVFFPRNIMIWHFDTDPDNTAPVQRLNAAGTFGARAVVPFSDSDLIFYDQTGLRSLRARDSSRAAMTVDIGSAIDALTVAAYAAASDLQRELTVGVVDPATGRLWMAIGDTIFILSSYQATKVTAWSIYRPGFSVDAMVAWNDHIYLRSGDDFYVYGGEGEPAYSDTVETEVWLPYLDANVPAQAKTLHGVDVACRGVWEVRVGFDPRNLNASDLLGRVNGTTYGIRPVSVTGRGTHIGLRFRVLGPVSATEPAVLAAAAIHHDLDDQTDS
jgi:hypothetical protein